MTNTSVTLQETGIADAVNDGGMKAIGGQPDYALGSVHAVTRDGTLVIASASGSQLASYAWGAANVIFVIGPRNSSRTWAPRAGASASTALNSKTPARRTPCGPPDSTNDWIVDMPLTGEYQPSAASWARDQVDLYERSGGTQGTDLNGRPVIILTSLGARSGKVRKTPLMRVEHDGEYAVVASLGGAPQHPVWYYNLTANPHVELQDGPVRRDYQAREVQGAERDTWWDRAVAAYPDYAEYQKKTSRTIPVFVLTPAAA